MKHLAVFLITLCFLTAPAYAGSLSEGAVKMLYADMVKVYHAPRIDVDKAVNLMKKHYADDGQFKLTLKANIFPQPQVMQIGKAEMIDMTLQTVSKLHDSRSSIDITSVKLNETKDKAIVEYSFNHYGRVEEKTPNGQVVGVDYSSISSCRDLLAEKNSVLQVTRSICNMNANYSEPNVKEMQQ